MKLRALTLAVAFIITPNLHAGKGKTNQNHQTQKSMHDINSYPCLDQCIIATGLLCCLPCAAIEECYKKVFPAIKYHKPQTAALRKK